MAYIDFNLMFFTLQWRSAEMPVTWIDLKILQFMWKIEEYIEFSVELYSTVN